MFETLLGGRNARLRWTKFAKSIPCPRSCRRTGRPAQDTGRIHRSCEIRFVLSKPGPYANDESPVIRKWMVAESESDALEKTNRSTYSL